MAQIACYLLVSGKRTYIGATVDVDRRLDQHNRKRSGGAKATAGRDWVRAAYVSGFPTWRSALQFEWAWKHVGTHGFVGRMSGLAELLVRERPTRPAIPYSVWAENFRLWVHRDWISILEKIEACKGLLVIKRGPSEHPSYSGYSFPLYSFQSISSNMSSSTISMAQFQQLVTMIEALKVDVGTCATRLETLMTMAPAAVPAAPVAAKKRGPKPKATEGEAAATGSDSDGAKVRKPREKKVCPTAAEGVLRFGGSKGKYGEFSNLYKHEMVMDGETFATVQHYLAFKRFETTDAEYAAVVRGEKNAAMLVGRMRSKEHPARSDWDEVRSDLLMSALQGKFGDEKLRTLLLETGTATIEYESTTDSVLGIGADGTGANELGKALMALRGVLSE